MEQPWIGTVTGLRNVRLGFRQQEPTHIMENIIYNELKIRGEAVDVGSIASREKQSSITREIDFIVNTNGKRTYIHRPMLSWMKTK